MANSVNNSDPHSTHWLKTIIAALTFFVLCGAYLGLYHLGERELTGWEALRQLGLNVLPSIIAAVTIVIVVYFFLERKGLSSGQQLTDAIAQKVEQKLEESFHTGLLGMLPENRLRNRCVVIINGGSGVGKSTIAVALAKALGVGSVFSSDFVREGMRAVLPESDPRILILLASSYEAHTYLEVSERTGITEKDVVKGYEKQSEAMVDAINEIVHRIRAKREPVIMEGVNLVAGQLLRHLPPDLDNIVIINLHLKTEKDHLQRLRLRSEKSAQTPEQADKCIRNIKQIRIIDEYLHTDAIEAAQRHDHVISIDNSRAVRKAIDKIIDHLKKLDMIQVNAQVQP